jgi:hypothetical protein
VTRPPPGYRSPTDPGRDHWPSQPLVDGRAFDLLERWAQCFAIIAARLNQAEADAPYGSGQGDIRTYQRGGDPVTGRLDWGPDDGEWQGPWDQRPPRIADTKDRAGDTETKLLRKLRDRMCDSLAYDLHRFERELEPPKPQQQREAG